MIHQHPPVFLVRELVINAPHPFGTFGIDRNSHQSIPRQGSSHQFHLSAHDVDRQRMVPG
jgi:hypothetical protein